MLKLPIYLDYQATTPVDPRVLAQMQPYFYEEFGNAASRNHLFGWKAEAAVEKARVQIARALGAIPEEIIFTSGATESNNLAILGLAFAQKSKKHLITVSTEHRAVLDPCRFLEEKGFRITILPVNSEGLLDPEQVQEAIEDDTFLVSIMAANNEIGVLQPISEIAQICRDRGVVFHTDAAQALGKIPLETQEISADLMSFSAHKIYGPKGIGALYVRKQMPALRLKPLMMGGGHEQGLRSGTLNVPAIVGFGEAVHLAEEDFSKDQEQVQGLRDRLWTLLQLKVDNIFLNGDWQHRLPGNLNVSFLGVPSDALMMELRDIAVSSGSACSSASPKPSHVLQALKVGDDRVRSALRFGIGRFTTIEEIDYVATQVEQAVKKLRPV